MQIILIPHPLAKARTIRVSARHIAAAVGLALALMVGLALSIFLVTIRIAVDRPAEVFQKYILAAQRAETLRTAEAAQEGLRAMAVKLGETQAELTRLDAVGSRLALLAGIKAEELRFAQVPGMGGASPSQGRAQGLTLGEFRDKLSELSQRVENRTGTFGVVEAQLLDKAVRNELMPTMMPVAAPFRVSGFGQRIDPFTGLWAMHEGIDFPATAGTAIRAAAGGVVVFAEFHHQYGNVIDIDHGNDLVTRYAHASRLLIKEGDVVKRGRKIAETGSTGHSTGPHLHFEVRLKGKPQDPARFLRAPAMTSPVTAQAPTGPITRSR